MCLHERYDFYSNVEDLTQACLRYQEAVDLTPDDAPEKASRLGNLAICLEERYKRFGAVADLNQAIAAYNQSAILTPSTSPELPGRLNNLAGGLEQRYHCLGHIEDLQQAISTFEKAIALAKGNPIARSGFRSNLGGALLHYFRYTSDFTHLQRAIELLEEAVNEVPHNSPAYPERLHGLGIALSGSFDYTKSVAELQRSITAFEEALHFMPEESHSRADCLRHLALALRDRFRLMGDVGSLHNAVAAVREAVRLTPERSPHRHAFIDALALVLSSSYERLRPIADSSEALRQTYVSNVEEAIAAFGEAAQLASKDSHGYPAHLSNLAKALCDRYEETDDWRVGAEERTIDTYRRACTTGLDVAPESAYRAAYQWGGWAARRASWTEAAEAYGYGRRALHQLFRAQLLRRSKETWLGFASGVSAGAAYALARTGELRGAVEAIESGRALLLTEALERNQADLAHLETQAPSVYHQYITTVNWLHDLEAQDVLDQPIGQANHHLSDALRKARQQLDLTIQAIRQVPGYEQFFEPLHFEQIRQVAGTTVLIYLITTPTGGLALLLRPGGEVIPHWLDALTEDAIRDQVQGDEQDSAIGYFQAYSRWKDAPSSREAHTQWLTTLDRITYWLWDVAIGPLSEMLDDEELDQVIMVPGGLLALLPLHAAWHEDMTCASRRRYALDGVTISFMPNASTLKMARSASARLSSESLIAIREPQPVNAAPLPHARLEIGMAASCISTPMMLAGKEATKSAVLAAIASRTLGAVWHFSCHGAANPALPLESSLVLAYDDRLTLRELLAQRLSGARLVILSACETGIPSVELPDEVIGLPIGFLQAGSAGVIASLWSVSDVSTALLITRFYDLWCNDQLQPTEALRRAQIWLRDTTNGEKKTYFQQFLAELSPSEVRSPRIPAEVAEPFYHIFALEKQDVYAFAHPFHWAAFQFFGI